MHVPDCVWNMARTPLVAFQPIVSLGAHPLLAMDPFEAWVTQAGPIDVVALGSVLAVAFLHALKAKRPNRALLLASAKEKKQRQVEAQCKLEMWESF